MLARVLILPLTVWVGFACSEKGNSKSVPTAQTDELVLEKRSGTSPEVPNSVPHQQLDQNSPPDVLEDLKTFLFSLEHVEEKNSTTSFPSARGAVINSNINVRSGINREFTHIHMEPGPGSQHLTLKEKDYLHVSQQGWAVKHPWNDRLAGEGFVLMMVYAPRDQKDLDQIKKIIKAAWQLALSED